MPLGEFADRYPALVGHLCRAARADHVAHAYLVTGEGDSSLRGFALAWIQVCACTSRTAGGDACGRCQNCAELAGGRYPYLRELKPMSKSRQIRIDEVRELEHDLHLTTDGRPRYALIVDADRMNDETQNAFLKTLEEPVPNTVIVLVTANPALLRPTIRSRCQQLALRDNRLAYELLDAPAFLGALATLQPETGASVATRAASQLLAVFTKYEEQAESDGKAYRDELLAGVAELDPDRRKQIDEQVEAFQASRYLAYRANVLSAVHTWFAQEYLRAAGVPPATWPNAELYAVLPGYTERPAPALTPARRSLRLAEGLLDTLVYNVDQTLAIEGFCEDVCRRSATP